MRSISNGKINCLYIRPAELCRNRNLFQRCIFGDQKDDGTEPGPFPMVSEFLESRIPLPVCSSVIYPWIS